MTVVQLQQSVLQDVVSMMNGMSSCEKKKILDDIKDGLREAKEARKKNTKLQTAREFLDEIRN